jgi:hypothetical protein
MIRIKSKQKNFRRCGIPHDDRLVEYPDNRFTPEQLAILKAEPMLIVEVVQTKAVGDDIAVMTVAQITAEIARYQPIEPLKGVKKADLIEILKSHVTSPIAPKE